MLMDVEEFTEVIAEAVEVISIIARWFFTFSSVVFKLAAKAVVLLGFMAYSGYSLRIYSQ